ncbi:hypothetical protein FRC05_009901 [Tulasnella sp. 425]|nr:hypothetical protein FRC05_009901 [Tulasnella sp. 425]
MATTVWSVPARLTSAIAALLSKQVSRDEAPNDRRQVLEEQLRAPSGSESSLVEVDVDLDTAKDLFDILCGLCLELDTENALHENELVALEGYCLELQKKVAVLQSQLRQRGPNHQGPDGNGPIHYATEEHISESGKIKTVLSATPVLPYEEPTAPGLDTTTAFSQSSSQPDVHGNNPKSYLAPSPPPKAETPPFDTTSSSQTLNSDSISTLQSRLAHLRSMAESDDVHRQSCPLILPPPGLGGDDPPAAVVTLGYQDIDPGQEPDHQAPRFLDRDTAIPALRPLSTGDGQNVALPLSAIVCQPRAPATMKTVTTSMVGGDRAIGPQHFATVTTTTPTEAALLVISILPLYHLAQDRSCRACPTPGLTSAVERVSGSGSRICHQGAEQGARPVSGALLPTSPRDRRLAPPLPQQVIPTNQGPESRGGLVRFGPHWDFNQRPRNSGGNRAPGYYAREANQSSSSRPPHPPPSRPLADRVSSSTGPEGTTRQSPPSLAARISPVRPMRSLQVSHGLLQRSPLKFANGRLGREDNGPPKATGANQVPVSNLDSRITGIPGGSYGKSADTGGLSG